METFMNINEGKREIFTFIIIMHKSKDKRSKV